MARWSRIFATRRSLDLFPSLPATNAKRSRKGAIATKQSSLRSHEPKMDCFAEPVIGRRSAPTRWLAMTLIAVNNPKAKTNVRPHRRHPGNHQTDRVADPQRLYRLHQDDDEPCRRRHGRGS